jgi:hypothetical protein
MGQIILTLPRALVEVRSWLLLCLLSKTERLLVGDSVFPSPRFCRDPYDSRGQNSRGLLTDLGQSEILHIQSKRRHYKRRSDRRHRAS